MCINWGQTPQNIPLQGNQHIARVIQRNREHYLLAVKDREIQAQVKGQLRYKSHDVMDLPVIGDWVIFEDHENLGIILEIIPRFSVLSRKVAGVTTEEQPIAANIHLVGIVLALDGGRNYSSRTLERYLSIAWNSGAQPLVILNKSDLAEQGEAFLAEAQSIASGVEVLLTSAENGRGVDQLRQKIPQGKTVLLIGPSGVGKSALTNILLGKNLQVTGANRESDKRGRHTPTSSKMIPIPQGGLLIDTPGLKEIQLWGQEDVLDEVFQEILDMARNCRFKDCSHQREPGCAVQQALDEGTLDQQRYLSYLELKKELQYLESKQKEKGTYQSFAKSKKLSKYIKQMKNKKNIY
ncbi:MAG: ribosome small subunit-dependent GTPase A [Spirochaetaceae bacterium]|jgi:ribosome biogenesis GTPase|nr:ribosome small subunit-dependent GTPase A [Spirochaetaceae bacterium]